MQSSFKRLLSRLELRTTIVYIAFVLIMILFSLFLKNFATTQNLFNIAKQSAMVAIMAFGMCFVIGAGQIDLSIGRLAALSSLVVALMLRETNNVPLSIFVTLLLGVVVGTINATIMNYTKLPAFLVTMGMQIILFGVAMWITNTAAVPISNVWFNTVFGGSNIPDKPVLIIWIVVFAIIMHTIMTKTSFGYRAMAVGGNEQAALYSGINIKRVKLQVMILSSVLASIAGMLFAGRLQVGRHTYADGAEMFVIAAAVLGGTSMSGGSAYIIGAAVGAVLMSMLDNGLVLAGFSVSQQYIVRGIVVILAAALGSLDVKRKQKSIPKVVDTAK